MICSCSPDLKTRGSIFITEGFIMASWIAHLNVADKIAEHLKLDLVFFAAGNIAPDCGEKVAERVFVPDTLTTHFTKTDKDACDYEAFF